MNMYDICLLHAQSDRSLRSMIAARLVDKQITMMEWLLLGVVAQGSAKGVAMSDIAQELHVTLPQVTALVNKILPLKLIRQKSASNDRRSRLVSLTNKGQLVLEEVNIALEKNKADIIGPWSDEQINDYVKILKKISEQGI